MEKSSFVCLRPDGAFEAPSTVGIMCRTVRKKVEELGKIAHYDFESLTMTIFSSTFGYTFLNASFNQNFSKMSRGEFIKNSIKIFVNRI